MHSISRAYRDEKSPLTPLKPLSANTAFTFNISGDDTLNPFIHAIESQRAKETSGLSPAGRISSVKYVNPSKYINSQSANINASESTVKTKKLSPRFASTKNSRLESPSFVKGPTSSSGSKTSSGCKCNAQQAPKYASTSNSSKIRKGSLNSNSSSFGEKSGTSFVKSPTCDSGSDKSNFNTSNSKLSPKYASTMNFSKVRRDSLISNSSSLEETSGSSSYDSNSSGCTSYSSKNETSMQRCKCSSGASDSVYSGEYKTSSVRHSNATSTSSISGSSTKCKETNRRIPPKLVINATNEENGPTMSSIFNWVWNQLSPIHNLTIYELLTRVGMQKYWEIFKREEIVDLDVYSTLTMADLKTIGIKNSNDCQKILESVRMALDFLSGLFVLKKP